MSKKRTSKRFTDVPYDPHNREEVLKFWSGAIKHRGLEELRRKLKRGRPPLAKPKVAISLRLDPEVLAEWKATGPGWQTRMAQVLKKAV
ncbi:MAG: BrnA antitoxin family protein [Burkholderiales bacterium]